MLSKGDWMDIKAQIEQGVYPKDIAHLWECCPS